jgi:hypothetical protein
MGIVRQSFTSYFPELKTWIEFEEQEKTTLTNLDPQLAQIAYHPFTGDTVDEFYAWFNRYYAHAQVFSNPSKIDQLGRGV